MNKYVQQLCRAEEDLPLGHTSRRHSTSPLRSDSSFDRCRADGTRVNIDHTEPSSLSLLQLNEQMFH